MLAQVDLALETMMGGWSEGKMDLHPQRRGAVCQFEMWAGSEELIRSALGGLLSKSDRRILADFLR